MQKSNSAFWGCQRQTSTHTSSYSSPDVLMTTASCETRSKSISCCKSSAPCTKVPPLSLFSRPRSASRSPPGSAHGSRLSQLGSALAGAGTRSDPREMWASRNSSLPRLNCCNSALQRDHVWPEGLCSKAWQQQQQRVKELRQEVSIESQQSPNSSSVAPDQQFSRPLSGNPGASGEGTLGDELEQMGIPPLAAAATVARLSPGASLKEALNSLCHEPNEPLSELNGWECEICFTSQTTHGWHCPDGHRFCSLCMRRHVKAVAFPRCPQPKCGYDLDITDLRLLKVSKKRIEAFEQNKLETAIQILGSDSNSEKVMHCQRDGCSNVLLVPQGAARRECFACPCGAPSFCTSCGESPFHFHADCAQVPALRMRWMTWVGQAQKRRTKNAEAMEALQKKLDRDSEFKCDEMWKSAHCRLCPTCNRVLEKLEGCNAMRCGQDAHGGNKQNGCGATFNWDEAEPYSPGLQNKRERGFKLTPEEASRGQGLFHPGTECKICKQSVLGPRLRCIHCESFEACLDCEAQLDSHDLSHVFEIIYTPDFDWSAVKLKPGLTVRIVRSGKVLPPIWCGNQFEGKVGTIKELVEEAQQNKTYKIAIHGHKGSCPELPDEHLVPLFRTRDEAYWLMGGKKPRAPDDTFTIFHRLQKTHGALIASRYLNNPARVAREFGLDCANVSYNVGGWNR